jgi:hypothetical protein
MFEKMQWIIYYFEQANKAHALHRHKFHPRNKLGNDIDRFSSN